MARQTRKGLIAELREKGCIEVKERLTDTEYGLVKDGLVYQQARQDAPKDIPYPFRPVRYYLYWKGQ